MTHESPPGGPRVLWASRAVLVLPKAPYAGLARKHPDMVRLSKIYTKTGDTGQTMLGDGSMVPKSSPRVEAVGSVDEANTAIGSAAAIGGAFADLLRTLMNDLFDVGADLCTPHSKVETPGQRLRMKPQDAVRLEALIDEHNKHLAPLTSFVLPAGTELASRLHIARGAVRRAERRIADLMNAEPGAISTHAFIYINRLSDLLFVLARRANNDGTTDVLWTPGASNTNEPENQ